MMTIHYLNDTRIIFFEFRVLPVILIQPYKEFIMALHKKAEDRNNVEQPQVQPQVEQVEQPAQPQEQPIVQESNYFQNNLFGNGKLDIMRSALMKPFGGSGVNERISKLHQFFLNIYEEKKRSDPTIMNAKFIIANPSRIANLYGGIVIAIPIETPQGISIGAHLLIVETSLRPQPQKETYNGVVYSIPNTASNTVALETVKSVEHLVKQASGFPDAMIVDAGFSVIPEEVNMTDELTLLNILDNAAGAALTRLQLQTGNHEGDVALLVAQAIKSNEVSVHAHVEEHPGATTDICNQPIRSDFVIKTIASQNNTQNQAIHQALDIGSVNVFCSPVYSRGPDQFTPGGGVLPGKCYYNQVIIKDVKTGPEVRLAPSTLFLLIATTGLLAQNGLWKRKYIPNMSIPASKLDIGDIGAFGYECPHMTQNHRPEMVPTKTSEFTSDMFNRYMNALFHDQLVYQIDVPDGHYLLGILAAEASGQQSARDIIFDIINRLTEGQFAHFYPATEQMFINTELRIANGYYLDAETREHKPLDNIDYLALLNLTNGEAKAIEQFESSFMNTQASSLRMAIRTAYMEELTSGTMKVRSYSNRLTINPKFMEALINALRSARLFPEVSNSFSQYQTYTRPTAEYWARFAVDPNHLPNLTTGYGGFNPNQNYGTVAQSYMPMFNGSFR